MDNKCVECGGELIEGTLAGMYVACFYPKGEEKKLKGKKSKTVCSCCKVCGLIQNIRAIELDKIV
ncbi:MAG: hypothetical protein J6C27_01200 [Clostridia bacterium]|nr:hypothetical protein [Clostridia bacterium]